MPEKETRAVAPHPIEQLLGPLNKVELKNVAKVLYLAGDRRLLIEGRRVSIVGSRRATPRGLDFARQLSERVVRFGMFVVSGLAEGIDTVAHRTAISAGGRTIAVLGTPLDACYPPQNRGLQDLLAREHLLVSQFPPRAKSRRENFPMRNRTMALLSDATIIVEAGEKSGTVHQGWEALRLGRIVFLPPHLTGDGSLSWPREMVRYGAQILRSEDLDEILEEIPGRFSGPVTL